MMEDPMGMQPIVMSPPAKKMPYVLLTGLIPFRKQIDEYVALYATASYQSPERDMPIWHDYAVERLEVRPWCGGDWKVIDITRLYEDWKNTGLALRLIQFLSNLYCLQHKISLILLMCQSAIGGPLPALAAKPTLNGYVQQRGIRNGWS